MICLKRDYTLRLNFTSALCVCTLCVQCQWVKEHIDCVLHDTSEKSSIFLYNLHSRTHTHTERECKEKVRSKKKHMSCLLTLFLPYFFSSSASDLIFLWHITSNRLNAYLSLRWYFFFVFLWLHSAHTPHPHSHMFSLSLSFRVYVSLPKSTKCVHGKTCKNLK